MSRRYFDLIVAALGLLVLSPLLLIIAALIRLDDGGPVLFSQSRLGERRRPFRIYKFRSMRDERATRVGAALRATGLDELPQLVNLLLGDMSLIGPRPLTAADVERLGWDDEAHALRWRVKPGIAGLAQIYAGRGARLSSFLDRRYVQGRCLGLDLRVTGLAAAMCLLGKRRVRAWLRRRRGASPRTSTPPQRTSPPGRRPARMPRMADSPLGAAARRSLRGLRAALRGRSRAASIDGAWKS